MIIPPANVVMQVMRCAEDIKEVVVEEEEEEEEEEGGGMGAGREAQTNR